MYNQLIQEYHTVNSNWIKNMAFSTYLSQWSPVKDNTDEVYVLSNRNTRL